MKAEEITAALKAIIGGTPGEVLLKAMLAILAALWANIETMGLAASGYFVLLFVDSVYGAKLAKRASIPFSISKFGNGITSKFIITSLFLFCTAVVDSMLPSAAWIPESPIFYTAVGFICASQIIDIAKKYGTLSNSKIANAIEAKLGRFIKYEDPQP